MAHPELCTGPAAGQVRARRNEAFQLHFTHKEMTDTLSTLQIACMFSWGLTSIAFEYRQLVVMIVMSVVVMCTPGLVCTLGGGSLLLLRWSLHNVSDSTMADSFLTILIFLGCMCYCLWRKHVLYRIIGWIWEKRIGKFFSLFLLKVHLDVPPSSPAVQVHTKRCYVVSLALEKLKEHQSSIWEYFVTGRRLLSGS